MNHIIIFIKNPRLGKVKTRLAATLGDDKALDIYHRLLAITQKTVKQVEAKYHLFYSDFIDKEDDWSNEVFVKYVQHGEDLGDRMAHAFQTVLSKTEQIGINKVVIIGSDSAELTSEILDMSFTFLKDEDVVVGPTFDGGYYLLGMKKYRAELFTNISWSTANVYQETNDEARSINLVVANLPTLHDIDNEEDWLNAIEVNPDLNLGSFF